MTTRRSYLFPDPGRVEVHDIEGDPEYNGYWEAFVGDVRINGGVCIDYTDGSKRGQRAIEVYRRQEFHRTHYWDVETGTWVRKGELPPPVE